MKSKTLMIGTILIISTILMSFNAKAKKIPIDVTLTSGDGCVWHITGSVDASAAWGWPPIQVNSYDVTMSGPCGSHHFTGRAMPSGGQGNNGDHLPNVHAFRYKAQKLTPKTTPLHKFDKEFIHKSIVQYAIKNYDKYE